MIAKSKRFFKEAALELKKVTWPSKNELVGSTVVVIVTVLILAAFIGVVDVILAGLLKIILR